MINNKLKKKFKYTAFMDVLGFSNFMKTNITNDDQAENFYNKLKFVSDYLEYLKTDNYDGISADYLKDIEMQHTWISDTFVLTIEYNGTDNDHQIIYILSLAISSIHHFLAKEYGLLMRGGISSKYTFINDSILLGEGISEAHNLESKIAVNPRVIFSEDLITDEILKKLSLRHDHNNLNIISKDCDGYYFVNYLGALQDMPPMIGLTYKIPKNRLAAKAKNDKIEVLKNYSNIISYGLNYTEKNIKPKYLWLKEYHDRVLRTGMYGYNIIGDPKN